MTIPDRKRSSICSISFFTTFPLQEINTAFKALEQGEVARSIIRYA